MKNIHFKFFSFLYLLTFVVSCNNNNEKNEEGKKSDQQSILSVNSNLNLSIFLDLSDRIDPMKYPNSTMQYYQRDLEYVNSVSDAFENHVKSKKTRQINDNISIYFHPEPKDSQINELSSHLKFKFDKNNSKLETINSVSSEYKTKVSKIYDLTIKDNSYPGSDIWRFFEKNIVDYCVSLNHRNILVIMTDGYMYHEDSIIKSDNLSSFLLPGATTKNGLNHDDWLSKFDQSNFGFIPLEIDLSNLEILVLGINPDTRNPFEGKVIERYWTKWFNDMKVKRIAIKESSLPSNMDQVIKDFIKN